MAASFNLTAQINLRGPTNIKPIVADIKRQLGTIQADVKVNLDNKSAKSIDNITSRLRAMNAVLVDAKNNAQALNATFNSLSSSLSSVKASANNVSGSIGKIGQGVQQTAKNIKVARTEMEEFGKQSYLAIKRFAAFSFVTTGIFALTNAISSGLKAFITFDKELIRLQQVTGKGAIGISFLEKTITQLATSLGVSSESLTTVATTLAQAGFSAEETRTALVALAKTDLAPSFDDLTQTTEGAIAALRQFGLQAKDLEAALGSINAVAAAFAVESSDIITAIQRTGGVFASASKGVSEGTDALNEFIAIFTSVRATTRESAETIATGLRTIFTRIQRAKTIDQLKEFGVSLQDLEGKFVGPFEAIKRLSAALNTLDPRDVRFSTIVEELGGFRQIGKVIPLIQQFATTQQALGVAQKGQNSLTDAQIKAQQSLANQIAKVREQFLALIRDVGKSTIFQGLFKAVTGLASGLISLASAFKPILPILTIFGAVKGFSALTQFGSGFFGSFKKGGGAGAAGQTLGQTITGSKEKERAEATSRAADAIRLNTDALKGLTTAVTSLENTIKSRGSTTLASGGRVLGFNSGGIVPGSGRGDKVPAMLEPGEVVINNRAANKYGRGNLVRMNKYATGGRIQKFSEGKYVKSSIDDLQKVSKSITTDELMQPTDLVGSRISYKEIPLDRKDFPQIYANAVSVRRETEQLLEQKKNDPKALAQISKARGRTVFSKIKKSEIYDKDSAVKGLAFEKYIEQRFPKLKAASSGNGSLEDILWSALDFATGDAKFINDQNIAHYKSNKGQMKILSKRLRDTNKNKNNNTLGWTKKTPESRQLKPTTVYIPPLGMKTAFDNYYANKTNKVLRNQSLSTKNNGGLIQKFMAGGAVDFIEELAKEKKQSVLETTVSEFEAVTAAQLKRKLGLGSAYKIPRLPDVKAGGQAADTVKELLNRYLAITGQKSARLSGLDQVAVAGLLPLDKEIDKEWELNLGNDKSKSVYAHVRGFKSKYLKAVEKMQRDTAFAADNFGQDIQMIDIFGDSDKRLAFDFDDTLVYGADILDSEGKKERDYSKYSDTTLVEEALKRAKATPLLEKLKTLIGEEPDFIKKTRILTARPQSTVDLLADTLRRLGAPYDSSYIKGVGGPGVDIPQAKAQDLSADEKLIEDSIANVRAAKKAGKSAYLYASMMGSDSSQLDEKIGQGNIEGAVIEKALARLGAPLPPMDKLESNREIDFPYGLGNAAKFFGLEDYDNVPTEIKRDVEGSGLNRAKNQFVTYYQQMAKAFAVGGKVNPSDYYDAAINSGLKDAEIDEIVRYAKTNSFSIQEFKDYLSQRVQQKKDKAGLRMNPASLLRAITPETPTSSQKQMDLARSLMGTPDAKYNPKYDNARKTFALGGLADNKEQQKQEKSFGKIALKASGQTISATYLKQSINSLLSGATMRSGEVTATKIADSLYGVGLSAATKGYGPKLYDVVMEAATAQGGMLTSDRNAVSGDAKKVWEYYFKNRGDVKKTPLSPGYWTKNQSLIDPQLLGKPDTWPPSTDPAWILQTGYSKTPSLINDPNLVIRSDKAQNSRMMAANFFASKPIGLAKGGTVPAMVSNGEAYIPPKVAKKIGYGKLNKMNHADKNGMSGFAGGGVSVFKGPGSGTSDSIGPIGLPTGSFIIREKATKALGLHKGGFVGGVQKFAAGGTVTDKLMNTRTTLEQEQQNLASLQKRAESATGVEKVVLNDQIKQSQQKIDNLNKTIDALIASYDVLNTRIDQAAKSKKEADDNLQNAEQALVDKIRLEAKKRGIDFDSLTDDVRAAAIEKAKTGNLLVGGSRIDFSAENKAIVDAQDKSQKAKQKTEKLEEKKRRGFGDLGSSTEVSRFGMPTAPESPAILAEQKAYFGYKAEKAGMTERGYREDLARQVGAQSYALQQEQKFAKTEARNIFAGRARELKGVDISRATAEGATGEEATRVQGIIEEFANNLRKADPSLGQGEARKAALAMADGLAKGKMSVEEIIQSNKQLKAVFDKTISDGESVDEAFRRVAEAAGLSAESLKQELSPERIKQQRFIASKEGQRFGKLAEFAPGLLERFSKTRLGGALGAGADFISGKGGRFSRAFAGMGGFAGIGSGLAVGAETLKQFLPKSVTSDPNTAGALGALGGVGAGAAMGAQIGSLAGPIGTLIGGLGGALIGGIKGFFEAKNQAILTNALDNLAKSTSDLDTAFKKLDAEVNKDNLANAQQQFGKVLADQQSIREIAFSSPSMIGLGYSEAQRTEALDTYIQTSGSNIQSATRLAEADLNMKSFEDMQALFEKSNPIVEQYAAGLASATNQTVEQVRAQAEEEVAIQSYIESLKRSGLEAPKIQELINKDRDKAIAKGKEIQNAAEKELETKMLIARATKDVVIATERLLDTYRRVDAFTQKYSNQLDQFSTDLDASLEGLSGGTGTKKVNRENEQILGNISAYSIDQVRNAANSTSAFLGNTPETQQLANSAVSAKIIQDQLPSILNNAKSEEERSAAFKQVEDLFKEQKLSGPAVETILDEIEKKITNAPSGENAFSKEDIDNILKETSSLAQKGSETLSNLTKAYNDTIQKAIDIQERYSKTVLEGNNYLRRANQIRLNAEIDLAQALGKNLTLDELNKPFDAEIKNLTGGLVATGDLNAQNANDPQSIVNAIIAADKRKQQLENQQPNIRDAAANVQAGEEGAAAADKLTQAQIDNIESVRDLTIASNEGRQALEKLANDGSRAANALSKIQEEQKRAEGFGNVLEKIATADFNQQTQMLKQLQALQIASSSGPEAMMNPTLRRDAFAGLNDIRELLDPTEFNKIRADLLSKFVTSQGMNLNQPIPLLGGRTAQELIDKIADGPDANDPNVIAYKKAVETQATANEALRKLAVAQGETITRAMDSLKTFLSNDFKNIISNAIAEGIRNAQGKANGGVVYANDGAFMNFAPKGTDTIPAMLTPGEFVVNRKATKKNLGLLKAINSGTMYAATGGLASEDGLKNTNDMSPGFDNLWAIDYGDEFDQIRELKGEEEYNEAYKILSGWLSRSIEHIRYGYSHDGLEGLRDLVQKQPWKNDYLQPFEKQISDIADISNTSDIDRETQFLLTKNDQEFSDWRNIRQKAYTEFKYDTIKNYNVEGAKKTSVFDLDKDPQAEDKAIFTGQPLPQQDNMALYGVPFSPFVTPETLVPPANNAPQASQEQTVDRFKPTPPATVAAINAAAIPQPQVQPNNKPKNNKKRRRLSRLEDAYDVDRDGILNNEEKIAYRKRVEGLKIEELERKEKQYNDFWDYQSGRIDNYKGKPYPPELTESEKDTLAQWRGEQEKRIEENRRQALANKQLEQARQAKLIADRRAKEKEEIEKYEKERQRRREEEEAAWQAKWGNKPRQAVFTAGKPVTEPPSASRKLSQQELDDMANAQASSPVGVNNRRDYNRARRLAKKMYANIPSNSKFMKNTTGKILNIFKNPAYINKTLTDDEIIQVVLDDMERNKEYETMFDNIDEWNAWRDLFAEGIPGGLYYSPVAQIGMGAANAGRYGVQTTLVGAVNIGAQAAASAYPSSFTNELADKTNLLFEASALGARENLTRIGGGVAAISGDQDGIAYAEQIGQQRNNLINRYLKNTDSTTRGVYNAADYAADLVFDPLTPVPAGRLGKFKPKPNPRPLVSNSPKPGSLNPSGIPGNTVAASRPKKPIKVRPPSKAATDNPSNTVGNVPGITLEASDTSRKAMSVLPVKAIEKATTTTKQWTGQLKQLIDKDNVSHSAADIMQQLSDAGVDGKILEDLKKNIITNTSWRSRVSGSQPTGLAFTQQVLESTEGQTSASLAARAMLATIRQKDKLEKIKNALPNTAIKGSGYKKWFETFEDMVLSIGDLVNPFIKPMLLVGAGYGIMDAASSQFQIKEPQAKNKGGIIYASKGTLVNYQPKGTDTVPAMLTPGEFVVNAKSTKQHLPLLKSINSGNYRNGGVVYAQDGLEPGDLRLPVRPPIDRATPIIKNDQFQDKLKVEAYEKWLRSQGIRLNTTIDNPLEDATRRVVERFKKLGNSKELNRASRLHPYLKAYLDKNATSKKLPLFPTSYQKGGVVYAQDGGETPEHIDMVNKTTNKYYKDMIKAFKISTKGKLVIRDDSIEKTVDNWLYYMDSIPNISQVKRMIDNRKYGNLIEYRALNMYRDGLLSNIGPKLFPLGIGEKSQRDHAEYAKTKVAQLLKELKELDKNDPNYESKKTDLEADISFYKKWVPKPAQRNIHSKYTRDIDGGFPGTFSKGGIVYANNGMLIPYQPQGTDTVPAMLTPGEFVVNRDATKNNLSLLHNINNGQKVSYRQNGGMIGNGGPMGSNSIILDQSSINSLNNFNSNFGKYVNNLVNFAFPTIPDKIELVGNYTVDVQITGAAAFEGFSKEMKKIADDMITTRVNNLRDEIAKNTNGRVVKPSSSQGIR